MPRIRQTNPRNAIVEDGVRRSMRVFYRVWLPETLDQIPGITYPLWNLSSSRYRPHFPTLLSWYDFESTARFWPAVHVMWNRPPHWTARHAELIEVRLREEVERFLTPVRNLNRHHLNITVN